MHDERRFTNYMIRNINVRLHGMLFNINSIIKKFYDQNESTISFNQMSNPNESNINQITGDFSKSKFSQFKSTSIRLIKNREYT